MVAELDSSRPCMFAFTFSEIKKRSIVSVTTVPGRQKVLPNIVLKKINAYLYEPTFVGHIAQSRLRSFMRR